MTSSPEPAATPQPTPKAAPAAVTYRSFISEFIMAVSAWGFANFIEHALGRMIGFWVDLLREKTDGWMAEAEAAEAAAKKAAEARAAAEPEAVPAPEPESKPKAERKPRKPASEPQPAEAQPASAAAPARKLEDWDVPAQWSLPMTWPKPRPEGPVTRRAFGWLLTIMDERARPYRQGLKDLLTTPAMVTLFTYCPRARPAWIPLCWMLGVSSDPVRYPGRTPPPRRLPPPRVKLSKRERWWRALARDPDPQPRYIQREKSEHGGWRGIYQLRPKGNVFMDYEPFPDHIRRKT
jgi:hypothetical protein